MRYHEEFAREAVVHFLRARGTREPAIEPWSDPPDFRLTADGVEYAVEVTRIMESIRVGNRLMTEQAALAAMRRFAARVEVDARSAGILNGLYSLHLSPVADFKAVETGLRRGILAYLSETALISAAPRRDLWRSRGGRSWWIAKYESRRPRLSASYSVGAARWQDELQAILTRLLRTAVETKILKTRRLTAPVVLVLVDEYGFAEPEDWAASFSEMGLVPFHTVIRAYGDHECEALYSRRADWAPTS